jgi:hypothetical protein
MLRLEEGIVVQFLVPMSTASPNTLFEFMYIYSKQMSYITRDQTQLYKNIG